MDLKQCKICGRELDNPNDPYSEDCGGDYPKCMADIAQDPDCINKINKIKEGLKNG